MSMFTGRGEDKRRRKKEKGRGGETTRCASASNGGDTKMGRHKQATEKATVPERKTKGGKRGT